MHIVLVFNPVSGKGHARTDVATLASKLRSAGHTADVVETEPDDLNQWLVPKLSGCDLLIVCGGDGTVLMVLDAVVATGVPIYHLPEGTENLFARSFSMSADSEKVVAAVDRFKKIDVDVGQANGRRFLLMASLGFDAEVVHDLASTRTGAISHLSYVKPMLRQLFKWKPPALRVLVDGEDLIEPSSGPCCEKGDCSSGLGNAQRGFVIIANSRRYALGLDPAPQASVLDGQLDVVFVPVRSSWFVLWWFMLGFFGRLSRSRRVRVGKGRQIEIRAAVAQRLQLDGDPAGDHDPGASSSTEQPWQLKLGVEAGALSVLVPVDADTEQL